MKKCEMCLIPEKEKYRIISSNGDVFVCVIIEPLHNSHLMIIPKRHVTNLNDLTERESKELLLTVENISKILKNKFGGRGALTIMNHDEFKTQEHIHFHIMAINGGLRDVVSSYLKVPPRKRLNQKELEKITKHILE